jgi:hypothetical protein
MRIIFGISKKTIAHERKIYGIFDALGDFGGVVQVLEGIAFILLGPVSSMNFYLRAIQKLFLARTKEDLIFEEKKNPTLQRKLS